MSRTWKFLKRKFLDYKLNKWGTLATIVLLVLVPTLIALSRKEEPHGFKNPSRGKALEAALAKHAESAKGDTPDDEKEKSGQEAHKRHDKDGNKKGHGHGSKDEHSFIPPVTSTVRTDHEEEDSTGEYTHLTYEACGPYTEKRNHGVVVLLMLESAPFNMVETFARAMPSWDKFFLTPQGLDVLLVFPDNAAKDIEQVAEKAIGLKPHAENDDLNRKLGSLKVWRYKDSEDFRIYTLRIPKISIPSYAKHQLAKTDGKVTCGGSGRGFSENYVTGNMWYINKMFDLKLLSCYKYFFKVDYDVFFLRPLALNLFQQMEERQAVFVHSGTAVQSPCGTDMDSAMAQFAKENRQDFKTQHISFRQYSKTTTYDYTLDFPHAGDMYEGNFVGGRITFWNSKKLLKLAGFLENYPNGFYANRWTDQTYWHNALALYLPNYNSKVLNIEAERTMTVSNEEELQGSFFHAKTLDQQAMNLYCETVFGCSTEAADEMRHQMTSAEAVMGIVKHVRQCQKWGCSHVAAYFSRVLVLTLHEMHPVVDESKHRAELATVPRYTWPLLTELKLWRQKSWPGSNKPKNATYFLHFSKAGGTSVCNLYQKSGLPGIVTKTNCFDTKGSMWREGVHDGAYWGRSKYKYKSSYFVERTCAERNTLQKRKFFAVERYFDLEELCDNFLYMTIMRDPKQRLVSHLSHMQSVFHSQNEDKTRDRDNERFAHPLFNSLKEALDHAPEQSNFYVRHLLGKKGYFADNVGLDHMRRARQLLLQRFEVIMTLEHMDCTNVMLSSLFGKEGTQLPKENVKFEEKEGHSRDKTVGFLTDDDINTKLQKHTELDYMLYEAASNIALADCMIFKAH